MKLVTDSKNYQEPSVFTPESLLREARRQKNMNDCKVPAVCVLDPDGDLVDYLIRTNQATRNTCWACYHTKLYNVKLRDAEFAVLGCAVGSSFAVLIAEQLFVSGCNTLISITSAGVISPEENTSKFVLIERALRDEGTSYHYLPPSETSNLNPALFANLISYYRSTGLSVKAGISWTTDAPYRETRVQLQVWAADGVLAVEMQAASLFAFGIARQAAVASVAMVSNAVDHAGQQFDTGSQGDGLRILQALARAARSFLGE